jgi:two-component system response regulator
VTAGRPVLKIALVEDNPTDEALALRALERSGISNPVVVLRDGVEAVEYFLGPGGAGWHRDDPHVVLLDLKLPRLDGFEVLRRLREDERSRMLPVVVLTSSDEQRDLVEAYRLGVNSYIRKPVDFTQFADAIRAIGHYWIVLNIVPDPRMR